MKNSLSPREIGSIRRELGLTQVAFAQRLGVHPIAISRWERGENRPSPLALKVLLVLYRKTSLLANQRRVLKGQPHPWVPQGVKE